MATLFSSIVLNSVTTAATAMAAADALLAKSQIAMAIAAPNHGLAMVTAMTAHTSGMATLFSSIVLNSETMVVIVANALLPRVM